MSSESKVQFITPVATARYPHINEPDTKGKFADNKYKTQLLVTKKEAEPLLKLLKEVAKAEGIKNPQIPGKPLKDKDGEEDPNTIVFMVKSKFAPLVFDGKNKKVKKLPGRLSGGSKVRVAGIIYPYDKGVSLQMKQIQVLEFVEGGATMFGEDMEGSFDSSEYDSSDSDTGAFGGDAADPDDAPDI